MKSLHLNYKDISFRISKADSLFIFLDYDGTLAPITRRLELAFMPDNTRRVLKKLVKNKRMLVFIISGRVLKDVKKLVALKGIYYAGCHGLEAEELGSIASLAGLEKARVFIRQAERLLTKELAGVTHLEAIDIENKGFILALHYRRAKAKYLKDINRVFYSVSRPYVISGEMVVIKNKKVLELKPAINWDKGMYCLHMLKSLNPKGKRALPIYIGDDRTDETAFKALKGKAITVFVRGERKTSLAEYYLDSTNEVKNFLQLIADSVKIPD